MTELTIYIPTYNRLNKLTNCLSAIKHDIAGYEDKVIVYVSNNASNDGTKEYLDNLDWIKVRHNDTNLGFSGNVIHGYNLPFESKFVWIIGDDDYLIAGSISELLELTKCDVDYIFCNTTAFVNESELEVWGSYPNIPKGIIKGKCKDVVNTTFDNLIDFQIADTLLGELMVNCFRQSAVRWSEDLNHPDEFERSGRQMQPHNLPFIECFTKETKALYVPTPRTFNFWGSAEWLDNYDYVYPIIMLWLIKKYKKFVSKEKYDELLKSYFVIMQKSLERQFCGISKAQPFPEHIKLIILNEFENAQNS